MSILTKDVVLIKDLDHGLVFKDCDGTKIAKLKGQQGLFTKACAVGKNSALFYGNEYVHREPKGVR